MATEQNGFYRVFSAYRRGIIAKTQLPERRIASSETTSNVRSTLSFEQLSYCAFLGHSSPRERLASRVVSEAARRGFLAAHAGELELARKHFRVSWSQWEELEEGICKTKLIGAIEGYEAYLEYRLGCRDEARRRLGRALDSALLLEQQYGLTLYELHRMQLGHNLARIDWRFGFFEDAFALSGALVGYLMGSRQRLPFHRAWRLDRLLCCPVYLRKAMIFQIAGESINQLVLQANSAYWRVFISRARVGADDSRGMVLFDPRLWSWLRAWLARSKGDSRFYLEALQEILSPGPPGLGTIYYSIIVDFAEFCLADHSAAAKRTLELIVRDSTKWKNFPAALAKRLFEISNGGPAVEAC